MAEREYAVIVKRGINLQEVDAELSATTGSGPIPDRSVDIANPRLGSKRMTHWMLTDEEAELLRDDDRILAVEIPPDQRDDIKIVNNATQTGQYFRGFSDANDVNWGLRRCIDTTNGYLTNNDGTISGDYAYPINGAGVDIVIQDSGIDPNHPEWEDANGVSRMQQIDWYTASGLSGTQDVNHYRDADGHGTHVAGIAAGKTYGWAKGANIYSQKIQGLELLSGTDGTGIPIADAFDAIRLWHEDKVSNRPTVVNMSWGYLGTHTNNPTNGIYQGTPWTYTTQADAFLLQNYGIIPPIGGTRIVPAQVAFADAEVEDMIDSGIHIVIAAGNDYYKSDLSTGADYNNVVVLDGIQRFYHRPGSPYSDRAFFVGNVDTATEGLQAFPNFYTKERTRASSRRGPAVNIWAPGDSIMSTASSQGDPSYTTYTYPGDASYEVMSIGGTSMAAPQVAGLCCLHLQSQPNLTPRQLLAKVIGDAIENSSVATQILWDTGNTFDYDETYSLMGSPNRMLYSRYGVDVSYQTTGSKTIIAGESLQLNKSGGAVGGTAWIDDNTIQITISSIISNVAIQVNASLASPPAVPFGIVGVTSGASTNVTNISANTGSLLELDVNNSNNFIQGESLLIVT